MSDGTERREGEAEREAEREAAKDAGAGPGLEGQRSAATPTDAAPDAAPATTNPTPAPSPATAPVAPPVVPGPVQARQTWPTVIGVVTLVFGVVSGLGALFGGFGYAMLPVSAEFMQMGAQQGGTGGSGAGAGGSAAPDFPLWLLVGGIAVQLVLLGLAVLQCVGAAKVLGRRAGGPRLLRTWAWLKIAAALPAIALAVAQQQWSMQLQSSMMQAQQGGPPAAFFGTFTTAMVVVTAAWLAAWMLSYPIFCLIWFGRERVRADVERWDR